MSYEAEQARLQLLMDECMNFDIEFDDEEDTNEVDNLETFEEDTDTEQEADDEDTVSETFEGPLFFGRDKKSKWRKHASTQKVKTRSKNIVTQLPGDVNLMYAISANNMPNMRTLAAMPSEIQIFEHNVAIGPIFEKN
ncbi:hypothetical protein MML48_3g00016414 [Holotrichia oblita]|uniref:Uncharacterized protein n=1 Tax=Holotrichia oblita TaxID=644536 RepID=A0ACB9TG76_HOLOL|nr:hypothetical protein MML48_3g00016414 [Holotrichia oblita]